MTQATQAFPDAGADETRTAVERLRRLGANPLRDEAELMQPEALGAIQPSPLSCSRYFLDRMFRRGWRIERTLFDVDASGAGTARYAIHAESRLFEFVALCNPPVAGGRGGRVLTGERDMNAALYEGLATDQQIETMRREMPKIYSGRAEGDTLIWCRSNRSMRIFDHVVERLASGRQPNTELIAETGYLMRNVGIEGNGIYGTRPFEAYGGDHPLGLPYMAQMLAGYMMREVSFDLAEHLARTISPDATPLGRDLKRFIGIGNGSAIGLVFFIYNRPRFIGCWMEMRERLLASASSLVLDRADPRRGLLCSLLLKAACFLDQDKIANLPAAERSGRSACLRQFAAWIAEDRQSALDLSHIVNKARRTSSREVVETLFSCMMDLLPDVRDALLDCFHVEETLPPSPTLAPGEIAELIRRDYSWTLCMDTEGPEANHFVWYQSVSNDEPRRGTRHDTPPSLNMIHNIAKEVTQLLADLTVFGPGRSMAEFLLGYPHHRYLIQRLELLSDQRFHTPRCNPFAADFMAVPLIRLVMVGFYGLEKPVDFLDRNSRGIMFHGAPSREELGGELEPGWYYPLLTAAV